MTPPTRFLSATLAVGLLLAGCSSTDDSSGVATLSAAADPTGEQGAVQDVDTEEAMLAFAQCMRDEGVDFADPAVGDDGELRFAPGGGGEGGFDADAREVMQTARDACGDLLEGLDVGGGPGGRGDIEIDTEATLAFAECMRDNGVTDFPDPSADGLPDREAMQALDFTSESFLTAAGTCQEEVGFAGPGTGGGRGFGGGAGGPGGGAGA